ncbi:MAG TPA: NAD-dependent epimerase/dehydratase family protein [Conexibacter sp.]|nr:NAD-dependent epimerase/dehydratase family protein [Conexibacter sp.]
MSRAVLVTGGYGLLGSWLVRALVQRGDRVVVLQRDRAPRAAALLDDVQDALAVVHGDLVEPGLLARALGEYDVDTVFHLAAQTLVGTANRSPLATFESNVRGTWTLLEACRLHGARRVLVAASDKAYGASASLPYREDQPLDPRYPYDVSKAATDMIARSYWHTFALPVAVTRFANLYGGGDLNRSRLVPEAIGAALAGRAPVIRSDGSPERDFLYVEDAVDAYLRLADALDGDGARGEAFNAGGGEPHAVRDVVARICALAGTDVEPDVRGSGTPAGEIDRQYVDASKLTALTGWAPRVGLDEGLRRTVDWYRAHPQALA